MRLGSLLVRTIKPHNVVYRSMSGAEVHAPYLVPPSSSMNGTHFRENECSAIFRSTLILGTLCMECVRNGALSCDTSSFAVLFDVHPISNRKSLGRRGQGSGISIDAGEAPAASTTIFWFISDGSFQRLTFACTFGICALAMSAILWVLSLPWVSWCLLRVVWATSTVSASLVLSNVTCRK